MLKVDALYNSNISTLHEAVIQNNLEALNVLIALGVDPDTRDNHGLAPMHYAAMSDERIESMKALIKAGADINIVSDPCDVPECREAMECLATKPLNPEPTERRVSDEELPWGKDKGWIQ